MRVKYLIIWLILASLLPAGGSSYAQVRPEESLANSSLSAANSNPEKKGSDKDFQSQREKELYYRVEIKEVRTNNNFWSKRVLAGFTNRNLRANLIGYQKFFPKPLDALYLVIIEKAFRFPIIFFFLSIILLLALNLLLIIAILFITNKIMNYRERKEIKLRALYEKILTDILLQVIDTQKAIQILSGTRMKRNYNLLIDVMMDFQKSFRGDADRQIIELYQELDLGRLSFNKTFAISFYQQVKGIRELTNMHPVHAKEMITTRLNDPKDIVRTEAQICYPHVNKDYPFDFLSFLEKPFSNWAQLNIYYYIKIHELPVPSFDKWLTSGNTNVTNFCLLMIDFFQQQEHAAKVIQLLNHPSELTRRLAIHTCGNLQLMESKPTLKKIFQSETVNNQLNIIKAFSVLGEDPDLPFLEETVRAANTAVRLAGCHALYYLSEAGRAHLEMVNHTMNFVLTPFIDHVKDPRN